MIELTRSDVPTGTVNGDLMLADIYGFGGAGNHPTPTGWTVVAGLDVEADAAELRSNGWTTPQRMRAASRLVRFASSVMS